MYVISSWSYHSYPHCGQRSNGAVFVLYFGIRATNKKLPLNYGHRAIFCGWVFLNVSSFYSHFINICGPVLFLVHRSLRNISSQKAAILTFSTAIAAFLFYAKQSQCIYNSKKIQFLLIYIYMDIRMINFYTHIHIAIRQ